MAVNSSFGGKMRIATLLLLCLTLSLSAGWERTYGGYGIEQGRSIIQTTEGIYIIAGYTESYDAGGGDVYLLKIDAEGDTIWTRTYGGSQRDYSTSLSQTIDRGFIIAGYTQSFGAGESDFYLVKTDPYGDTLWTQTYGGSQTDLGLSIVQTADGGYIFSGETESFGAGGIDVFLVKTDAVGDTIWTRTYGGSGDDRGYSIAQTSDGGYIIAGETEPLGADDSDIYLVKTDSAGDTLWTHTYGGSDYDRGRSVAQTSDGGYIIVGRTVSFGAGYEDVYLVKTDADGDTLWTRTYGGDLWDCGNTIANTTDGGYIIAGYTYSFGIGEVNIYLIKINNDGDTLWTRTYGGDGCQIARSVSQTTDGGYIIVGYTDSFGAGEYDIYLIKTDSLGYTGIEEKPSAKPEAFAISAYPNPFNSAVMIAVCQAGTPDLPVGQASVPDIEIFDINGRMVEELPRLASLGTPSLAKGNSPLKRYRAEKQGEN